MNHDNELRNRIIEELRYQSQVYSTEIGVAVSDQVVTLLGHVSSFAKKRAAEEAVKRLYGVKAIVNEIKVDLPGTGMISDSKIALSARAAFESNGLADEDILITVDDGWVTLEGEVESQDQKRMAEIHLCNLNGVRSVKNLISVKNKNIDLPTEIFSSFPIRVEKNQFADPYAS